MAETDKQRETSATNAKMPKPQGRFHRWVMPITLGRFEQKINMPRLCGSQFIRRSRRESTPMGKAMPEEGLEPPTRGL
jgi:hypothetical protein